VEVAITIQSLGQVVMIIVTTNKQTRKVEKQRKKKKTTSINKQSYRTQIVNNNQKPCLLS